MRFDIRFEPYKHQHDAIEATRKYEAVWMCGGLGAGKTHVMVHWIWRMTTEWMPGMDGLIVEPDYATFEDTFMALWRQEIPGEGVIWERKNTSAGGRQLVIDVGQGKATVYVRSAMNAQNVQRIDGLTTLKWAAMDEPARMLCGESAFQKIKGRLRNPVNGWKYNPVLMVGSPRGLHHWTSVVFDCTEDHPDHGYTAGYEAGPEKRYFIRACKTKDNRSLREGYEEENRAVMSGALAAQEFEASLISHQGMIFPEWKKEIHVIPHSVALELWNGKDGRGGRVVRPVGGIDWGFTAPGAIAVCGWTHDQELIVIDEWYRRGQQKTQQGQACLAYQDLYGKKVDSANNKVIPWYADDAEPGSIELLRKGFRHSGDPTGHKVSVPVRPATQAKRKWQAGIDLMRNLMGGRPGVPHLNPRFGPGDQPIDGCPRFFVSDKCVNLIREIPGYRQAEQKEGQAIKEGADETCPDHMIDAVRYAAYMTDLTINPKGYGYKK